MSRHDFSSRLDRAVGMCLVAVGALAAIWAVSVVFATPAAFRTPAFAHLQLVAWCLVASGVAMRGPWGTTLLWAALSLVGHATSLQLVDAGPAVLYQHLRPAVGSLGREDWWLLGVLGAYVGTVFAGVWTYRTDIASWIDRNLGWGKAGLVLLIWAAISASPLKDLGGFTLEIGLATLLAVTAMAAVVVAAASLPDGPTRSVDRMTTWLLETDHGHDGVDRVAAAAALFTTGMAAFLSLVVWERHPHISDEISFLFQAKYFAGGALQAPGVPVPELFAAYQIECSVERCLSVLQPGWPALLSVGVWVGLPWLVNPLIAGVNVLLLYWLVLRLYGRTMARGAALLMATSPWVLFLGMSFMNHQATLLGGLVAVLGSTLAVQDGRLRWALMAGSGAGLTSLMRPMDGLIVALVAGLPLLLVGPFRRRFGSSLLFGIGAAALAALNLAYNNALTGHPLDFPVTSYVNELWGEGTNNLGFGPDRGVYPLWSHMDGFPGHSPLQAVVNAVLNVTALQVDLFGWAIGSLLPVIVLVVLGRLRRTDWLMVGWIVVINLFYSLYWFASGPDFAARYWFLAVAPLVILTARGLAEVGIRIQAGAPTRGRAGMTVALLLLVAQSLFVFVPWRSTDKYHGYFSTRPWIREALAEGSLPEGVLLVPGRNQPDYAAAMIYTAPDLAGGRHVIAFDSLSTSVELARRAFPTSDLWWLEAPDDRTGVYRVRYIEGSISR